MSLLLFALAQLVLLAVMLPLFFRYRSMKRRQDSLVQSLKGQRFWRINVARPRFFERWLRLLAFEGKGVLIAEGDHSVRIKGFWNKDGRAFDVLIDLRQSRAQWLGNRTLRSGNLHWGQLTTPRGEILFTADTGMNALLSREALADIFRAVFTELELTEEQTQDFALEKNPRSRVVMVLFFALLFFALIDTFVVSRFELTDAQIFRILRHPLTWAGTLVSGVLVWLLTYRQLLGGGVPARESQALTGLLVTVLLLSALPVAKRIDQVLADAPAKNYDYRITGVARLEPADPRLGLPPMTFPRAKEFWSQYPTDSTYPIPYLRGPMGLWQLDHEAFDAPIRAFYEKR
ncbi:hypothetical protein [Acidovorax sp. NCPPB 4044]|uniref:hypothetical protein n=1 Tax=Acidovorax sp. NCPPB 4044 TaxID=2940490 RepID=UPI002302D92E|nr:hypothetical protein [Acidovorax sp. NCPPB 4044]MDA8521617.1 hypothetical protein [Acidovorax sp. NCPPB 4044]